MARLAVGISQPLRLQPQYYNLLTTHCRCAWPVETLLPSCEIDCMALVEAAFGTVTDSRQAGA
jgi:hypothetical protein